MATAAGNINDNDNNDNNVNNNGAPKFRIDNSTTTTTEENDVSCMFIVETVYGYALKGNICNGLIVLRKNTTILLPNIANNDKDSTHPKIRDLSEIFAPGDRFGCVYNRREGKITKMNINYDGIFQRLGMKESIAKNIERGVGYVVSENDDGLYVLVRFDDGNRALAFAPWVAVCNDDLQNGAYDKRMVMIYPTVSVVTRKNDFGGFAGPEFATGTYECLSLHAADESTVTQLFPKYFVETIMGGLFDDREGAVARIMTPSGTPGSMNFNTNHPQPSDKEDVYCAPWSFLKDNPAMPDRWTEYCRLGYKYQTICVYTAEIGPTFGCKWIALGTRLTSEKVTRIDTNAHANFLRPHYEKHLDNKSKLTDWDVDEALQRIKKTTGYESDSDGDHSPRIDNNNDNDDPELRQKIHDLSIFIDNTRNQQTEAAATAAASVARSTGRGGTVGDRFKAAASFTGEQGTQTDVDGQFVKEFQKFCEKMPELFPEDECDEFFARYQKIAGIFKKK